MSTESGQVLREAHAASSKIIRLPGACGGTEVVLPQQAPGGAHPTPAGAGVPVGRGGGGAVAMLAAAAAQTVALVLFTNSGRDAEPWAAAAVFGLGVTIAAGFTTMMAILFNRRLRAAGGVLSYDALTMALIMAASPLTTAAGALLLLPAITTLSLAVQRVSTRRVANEHDMLLTLAVLIALAGICQSGSWHVWIVAATALIAGILLQTTQKWPPIAARRRQWHVWMKTSLLCIAIASTMLGRTGTAMLLAAPEPALLAFVAGVLYGGGVGIACSMRNRRLAAVPVAAAPFLAVALLCAVTDTYRLPVAASAVLLAVALTLSNRKVGFGLLPLTRPLACPAGES